jgi:hypothetical protein
MELLATLELVLLCNFLIIVSLGLERASAQIRHVRFFHDIVKYFNCLGSPVYA